MSFHNVYNFFFLSLQTIAIAHLFYGSKAICEKFALIVQWIERRFPKPLIRVRFPVGVLLFYPFILLVFYLHGYRFHAVRRANLYPHTAR